MNLSTEETQTLRHREQIQFMVVKGQEVRGGTEWEFGTSRWKLLYTERITN